MKLRKFSILLPLMLMIAALLAPTPAAASDTTNYAGRPLSGSAFILDNPSCHGIAYGRVNNLNVLFVASHCYTGLAQGTSIYNKNGVRIGGLGNETEAGIQGRDLRYIKLDTGQWPASRNRIYRGDVAGDDFWTMTAQPRATTGCSRVGGWDGTEFTAYHNWQPNDTDLDPYRTGRTTNVFGQTDASHCTVQTSLTFHGTLYIDSSSPWVLASASDQLWGWSSSRTNPGDYLLVTPMYDALYYLDQYWGTRGNQVGAWICTTAAC